MYQPNAYPVNYGYQYPNMHANAIVTLPDVPKLNLFIGQLPADLHDGYIRTLLDNCGRVESWKRVMDPLNGKPKGFGYAVYYDVLDTIMALKLLDGFSIDSKTIVLKVDVKVQAKLDAFKEQMPAELTQMQLSREYGIRSSLKKLYEERCGRLGGQQNDVGSWGELVDKGEKDASEVKDGTAVRGEMIMSEIEKFRQLQEQKRNENDMKHRMAIREKLKLEKEEILRKQAEEANKTEIHEEVGNKLESMAAEFCDKNVMKSRKTGFDGKPRSRREEVNPPAKKSRFDMKPDVVFDENVKVGIKLQPAATKAKNAVNAKVFLNAEDTEIKPVRKIVPIDYTVEEIMATAPVQDRVAASIAKVNVQKGERTGTDLDHLKLLISQIPTSKDGLFSYYINWDHVDQYGLVDNKMQPWIVKKVTDYIGEEEKSLVDFFLTKLKGHSNPTDILNDLQDVMEDDAELFMKQLWRKLIFESLRCTVTL